MKDIINIQKINNHQIATVLHSTKSKKIVIFCHGFRGTSVGPSRFFVRAARKLAKKGVASLRFDQYGSGNSEGDFLNSSFNDWCKTIEIIARRYLEKGFHVSLFGQSMGASAAIATASRLPQLNSLVAWVPDPNVGKLSTRRQKVMEEGGQVVRMKFWEEAHDAMIAKKLVFVKAAAYIVQCTDDEYVDAKNRAAISENAQPNHQVEIFKGLKHSSWSYEKSEKIIDNSVEFLEKNFKN